MKAFESQFTLKDGVSQVEMTLKKKDTIRNFSAKIEAFQSEPMALEYQAKLKSSLKNIQNQVRKQSDYAKSKKLADTVQRAVDKEIKPQMMQGGVDQLVSNLKSLQKRLSLEYDPDEVGAKILEHTFNLV